MEFLRRGYLEGPLSLDQIEQIQGPGCDSLLASAVLKEQSSGSVRYRLIREISLVFFALVRDHCKWMKYGVWRRGGSGWEFTRSRLDSIPFPVEIMGADELPREALHRGLQQTMGIDMINIVDVHEDRNGDPLITVRETMGFVTMYVLYSYTVTLRQEVILESSSNLGALDLPQRPSPGEVWRSCEDGEVICLRLGDYPRLFGLS